MPDYRAAAPIYLSNERRLIAAGEHFSSDETPGLAWVALDGAADATAGVAPRGTASRRRTGAD